MKILQKAAGPLVFMVLFASSLTGRITPVSLEKAAPDTISAEVKGAVSEPGVYTLKNGASIQDLIGQAGGALEFADLSNIRLMEEVHPGQVIVIGKKEADGSSSLISINSASAEELMALPGIGESMAARIVEYRSISPFQSLEQLMEVSGIGPKKYEQLKDFIAL